MIYRYKIMTFTHDDDFLEFTFNINNIRLYSIYDGCIFSNTHVYFYKLDSGIIFVKGKDRYSKGMYYIEIDKSIDSRYIKYFTYKKIIKIINIIEE